MLGSPRVQKIKAKSLSLYSRVICDMGLLLVRVPGDEWNTKFSLSSFSLSDLTHSDRFPIFPRLLVECY